jgi:hypothetical protein
LSDDFGKISFGALGVKLLDGNINQT